MIMKSTKLRSFSLKHDPYVYPYRNRIEINWNEVALEQSSSIIELEVYENVQSAAFIKFILDSTPKRKILKVCQNLGHAVARLLYLHEWFLGKICSCQVSEAVYFIIIYHKQAINNRIVRFKNMLTSKFCMLLNCCVKSNVNQTYN